MFGMMGPTGTPDRVLVTCRCPFAQCIVEALCVTQESLTGERVFYLVRNVAVYQAVKVVKEFVIKFAEVVFAGGLPFGNKGNEHDMSLYVVGEGDRSPRQGSDVGDSKGGRRVSLKQGAPDSGESTFKVSA